MQGTAYTVEEIETIMARVFELIKSRRPQDADAIIAEHGLGEWLYGEE